MRSAWQMGPTHSRSSCARSTSAQAQASPCHHTAVATASAISRAGAAPVFVDVDPQTFTLCPRALRHTLASSRGRNIRAVIAVHLYGHPAAWDDLQRVADEFSLPLIEDCAQAHGAAHHGRPVGGLGRAAAFSFYPTKNLGAIGDGGAVTTDDADLAERIRIIRQYGWRQRYISEREGINSRLDEMQAAILRVKLRTLHQRLASRRELASRYKHHLGAGSHAAAPLVREGCVHAYHLYVIRSPHRDALMRHLTAAGIPVALHYPAAVHQQPAYAGGFAASSPLTNTDQSISEILTLPLHPYLTAAAVDATCAAIATFKP